jgi:hypothetical protein
MSTTVRGRSVWQRQVARILVIIAIVFWLWYGIGSAITVRGTIFDWFMYLMMPGGIFILSALIAWRWNRLGGSVLTLEGLVAQIFISWMLLGERYQPTTFFLMTLTLSLPPLLSGVLFLIYGLRSKKAIPRESIVPQEVDGSF